MPKASLWENTGMLEYWNDGLLEGWKIGTMIRYDKVVLYFIEYDKDVSGALK